MTISLSSPGHSHTCLRDTWRTRAGPPCSVRCWPRCLAQARWRTESPWCLAPAPSSPRSPGPACSGSVTEWPCGSAHCPCHAAPRHNRQYWHKPLADLKRGTINQSNRFRLEWKRLYRRKSDIVVSHVSVPGETKDQSENNNNWTALRLRFGKKPERTAGEFPHLATWGAPCCWHSSPCPRTRSGACCPWCSLCRGRCWGCIPPSPCWSRRPPAGWSCPGRRSSSGSCSESDCAEQSSWRRYPRTQTLEICHLKH